MILQALGQNFFYLIYGKKKSDLGLGGRKKINKKALNFFYYISRKNSKTSKVNQPSVLNL